VSSSSVPSLAIRCGPPGELLENCPLSSLMRAETCALTRNVCYFEAEFWRLYEANEIDGMRSELQVG